MIILLIVGVWAILFAANEVSGSVFHVKIGCPVRKYKFNIRIEPAWYSEEYVYVEYTNNHGLIWNRIIDSQNDYSSGNGHIYYKEIATKTWKIYDGLKENLHDKFSDIDACRNHNKAIHEYINRSNERQYEALKKRGEEIKKFFKNK